MPGALHPSVRLLYFAALKDLVGLAEETADLPEGVRTVADLARWLETGRPALRGRLGAVRFAVNEAFADGDQAVNDGDVVALIPPVSGG